MNEYEELLKNYVSLCRKIKEFKKFSKGLSATNNDVYFILTYSEIKYDLTRYPLLFVSDDCSVSDYKKSIKLIMMFANKSCQFENYFINNFRVEKK